MKKILIYDVAAAFGGAKKVLDEFYEMYKTWEDYECYFVTSVLDYPTDQRMHVIKLTWTKKSWIHRLYCDYFYMPGLIRKLEIEEVLSLQNIGIPHCPVKQTVYVHNAIPFTEHRFSLIKEPFLWVYQNVIGRFIYSSLKKADSVIVQTQWMKEEVVKRCQICSDKISVQKVHVKEQRNKLREILDHPIFFYPATPFRFKNFEIVLEACRSLKEMETEKYEIVMTFSGKENRLARTFAKKVRKYNLPIRLVGWLNVEQMESFYKKSILLFPSYLETIGLPLLEAKAFQAPIIAADCKYAHDALNAYANVLYFSYEDQEALKNAMLQFLQMTD